MPRELIIGEDSTHPESPRIGRFLKIDENSLFLDNVVAAVEETGADQLEAAFVRTDSVCSPAIGLKKDGTLVGYVAIDCPSEYVDLNKNLVRAYSPGPQVEIQER